MGSHKVALDPELTRRYDKAGPRCTSYPTAVQYHPGFGEAQYHAAVAGRENPVRPLSLYFHTFCDTVCFYRACSKIVTRNRAPRRILHTGIARSLCKARFSAAGAWWSSFTGAAAPRLSSPKTRCAR